MQRHAGKTDRFESRKRMLPEVHPGDGLLEEVPGMPRAGIAPKRLSIYYHHEKQEF